MSLTFGLIFVFGLWSLHLLLKRINHHEDHRDTYRRNVILKMGNSLTSIRHRCYNNRFAVASSGNITYYHYLASHTDLFQISQVNSKSLSAVSWANFCYLRYKSSIWTIFSFMFVIRVKFFPFSWLAVWKKAPVTLQSFSEKYTDFQLEVLKATTQIQALSAQKKAEDFSLFGRICSVLIKITWGEKSAIRTSAFIVP